MLRREWVAEQIPDDERRDDNEQCTEEDSESCSRERREDSNRQIHSGSSDNQGTQGGEGGEGSSGEDSHVMSGEGGS
jgi:hypothetical protein